MDWQQLNAYKSSPSTSLEGEIMRSLGRLEAGQGNIKAHLDDRIDDLRDSLSGRIDRMDIRVAKLEAAKPTQSPWWRDMSGREWMIWALVISTAFGFVKVEVLERLLSSLHGIPK